jgi:hypothetical protein
MFHVLARAATRLGRGGLPLRSPGFSRTDAALILAAARAEAADLVSRNSFSLFQCGSGRLALSGGVPEPATWALMLLGFGGIGLMPRRRPRIA